MKNMRILLLDIHPSAELGITLDDILASSPNILVNHLKCPYTTASDLVDHINSHAKKYIEDGDVHFLVSSSIPPAEVGRIISILNKKKPNVPLVIVSEASDPDEAIEYLKLGAADYIPGPLRAVDILPRLWRLVDHAQRRTTLTHTLKTKIGLQQMIGESAVFREVINTIPLIAQSDVCVQISGETGTGKELCARAIHYLGPRAGKPFLPVNCGAIPTDLVENELFGHVRGAYTGATHSHDGLISEADEGTLFLDEIDCLPLQAQVKLLRFLQEKEYRKLGSSKVQRADVRIIVAANTELDQAVKTGRFRQDLFYRLSIIHVPLPPLRERIDDLPLLTRHFLEESADEAGKQINDLTPRAIQKLCRYDWPGNVRELENIIKRAVIFSQGNSLKETDICLPHADTENQRDSFRAEKAKVIADFEKRYMQGLLQTYQGNITKAAQAAQKNRRAFWELMRKYEIDGETFKPHSPKSRI